MELSKPIGCRALHLPKKIGKSWVCMYCGNIVDKNDFTKLNHIDVLLYGEVEVKLPPLRFRRE